MGKYGLLRGGTEDNFDVALARLLVAENDPALADVLERLAPFQGDRFGATHQEISELRQYLILTPHGVRTAKYVRGWKSSEQVAVDYGKLGRLRQRVLVIESSLPRADTMEGDSGSPVVTMDRTRLIGMHFAGDRNKSYMIPAY